MKPFIFHYWHVWEGNDGILLSNEEKKEVYAFHKVDDAINYLWAINQKEAARALNEHIKESQ